MSERKMNVEGHGLSGDFKGKWAGSYHKIARVIEWIVVTPASFLNNWWIELPFSEMSERKKEVLFLGEKMSNFEGDLLSWLSIK